MLGQQLICNVEPTLCQGVTHVELLSGSGDLAPPGAHIQRRCMACATPIQRSSNAHTTPIWSAYTAHQTHIQYSEEVRKLLQVQTKIQLK